MSGVRAYAKRGLRPVRTSLQAVRAAAGLGAPTLVRRPDQGLQGLYGDGVHIGKQRTRVAEGSAEIVDFFRRHARQ